MYRYFWTSCVEESKDKQARSSGGERYLDAVEVWGSNPHVPTIKNNFCVREWTIPY